jgi:hypothetical protein
MKETENAVLLPILVAEMKNESATKPTKVDDQQNQDSSDESRFSRTTIRWQSVVVLLLGGLIILGISILPADSTKKATSKVLNKSPLVSSKPDENPLKAELDWDHHIIEQEKAESRQLASEIKSLYEEIERERSFLDSTDQFAVDEFNRKVAVHNELLEKLRAKDRSINQLVERYNQKLRLNR